MKHNYTALDSAILEALKSGVKKFRELENEPGIKRESIKVAAKHNASAPTEKHELKPWVFVNRRLISLEAKQRLFNHGNAVGYSLSYF